MFAPPSVRSYQNPGDQLEPMTRYIVTLVSFEDQGVSIYEKDKSKPDAEHSILWKWNVHNSDGLPVFDGDEMWEHWEWTSNRTGMKQDGSPSACRARLQALVGRELTDEEVTRFIADEANVKKLPGRRAYATFFQKRKKDQAGNDAGTKPAIQSIMPYKEKAGAPVAVATPPAPVPAPPADVPFDPPAATASNGELTF